MMSNMEDRETKCIMLLLSMLCVSRELHLCMNAIVKVVATRFHIRRTEVSVRDGVGL